MVSSSGFGRRGLLVVAILVVAVWGVAAADRQRRPAGRMRRLLRPEPIHAEPQHAGSRHAEPVHAERQFAESGCRREQPSPQPVRDLAWAERFAHRGAPGCSRLDAGCGGDPPEVKRLAVEATVDLLRRPGTRSVVEVIDAQYGGILANSASVLVPCRVHTLSAGRVVTGGTTVDVRLTKSGSTWRVTATHPAQPGAATTRLSTTARQVLSNGNIALPPASIADVHSGQVHDTVLTAMLELAKTYRIGISVIRSGHPLNVFGTTRPSDHPRGRAFDTWQINGRPVVSPSTSRTLITSYMRAAASAGSYNVGGPYQLSRRYVLLRPNPPRPHPRRLPHLSYPRLLRRTRRV